MADGCRWLGTILLRLSVWWRWSWPELGKPCAQPIYQHGVDFGYWMLEVGAASTMWGVAGAMMRMVVVVGCVCLRLFHQCKASS